LWWSGGRLVCCVKGREGHKDAKKESGKKREAKRCLQTSEFENLSLTWKGDGGYCGKKTEGGATGG